MRLLDLTDQRFGRLVVLDRGPNKGKRVSWRCRCDCGNETTILALSLRRGATKSCGCRRTETNRKRLTTHGRRHTPEYKAWCDFIDRCENPNNSRFKSYGDRGITVCEEWRSSFQKFFEDVGFRPSGKHSIDRMDNDKGYEPSNCRWATRAEQSRNTTMTRMFTADGRTQCLKDWADELGCASHTIATRLKRGWSVEEAITTPPLKRNWRRS